MRFPDIRPAAFVLAWLVTFCLQARAPAAGPGEPGDKSNVWTENFDDPFIGWRDRFFYKNTDAESYYVQNGNQPGFRPSDQKGMWISARGVQPATTKKLTLRIKPSLGMEASYFSLGVNSHLPRLTITFLDKDDKTIALSCAPQTDYYVYVTVAVRIKSGLKAIVFDGHDQQVPGNVNINHVEAVFGRVPEGKDFVIHEEQDGKCKVLPARKRKEPTPIDPPKPAEPARTG